jgi:hypothetical protein
MTRLRRASWLGVVGLGLVAGCASPCGEPWFNRWSLFRHSTPECCCPTCDCCASVPFGGEGPYLGDPGFVPGATPGFVPGATPGFVPGATPVLPPSPGVAPVPAAPVMPGAPAVPSVPGRLQPLPDQAIPVPAEPSSRRR